MVAGFLDAITKVRQFRFHNDDDFIDRLSRRYSVILLMLFTVVVSTKQYVGDRKLNLILDFLLLFKSILPNICFFF
jgi:hypothetical protein